MNNKELRESVKRKFTGMNERTVVLKATITNEEYHALIDTGIINPCEKHMDFHGECCPVCLAQQIADLQCCGNCKSFEYDCNFDHYKCEKTNLRSRNYKVCPSWQSDGMTREDREK